MKVAQFPTEGGGKNDITDLGMPKRPDKPFPNGYSDLYKPGEESKLGMNGFVDGLSEHSTSESTGGSPHSADASAMGMSPPERFEDAHQTIPEVAVTSATLNSHSPPVDNPDGGHTGAHGTNEPTYRWTADTGAESPKTTGKEAVPNEESVPGESKAGEQQRNQLLVPGQNPDKSSDETAGGGAGENVDASAEDSAHRRNQSVAQGSQAAPSTTSRRAVAAAVELEDGVLVGTRVSEGHENFVTAYNMLTGIRVAVSRCTAKSNRALNDADFSATDEIKFNTDGGSPSSRYMFHFKDYAPWVFRHLRDAFGLDPADYLMSLTAKYIVSEMGSPGKSGSYFYYSRDFRFIIKTIRHSEHKLLRRILRQYYSHVKANPDTLISQIYGLHRVKISPGRKIHFLIMNNVFPALYQIHERYDLKGSMLGREYTPDPRKSIVVYKDLDWLRKHKRIVLGHERRERLVKQLDIDVKFLEKVNVMDYSLLVGIHDRSQGNAALDDALRKFAQFGPQDERQSQGEKQAASAAVSGGGSGSKQHRSGNSNTEKEFASLQMLLQRATPERLKEFDFADDARSQSYFYREHGGFFSTDENNREQEDVIYYVGVIDFLTGYTLRKSIETFCKGLIHDRRELSAVPSGEYGDRFLKFMRGSIGPLIPSSKPQKRHTDQSQKSAKPADQPHSVDRSAGGPADGTTDGSADGAAAGTDNHYRSSVTPAHTHADGLGTAITSNETKGATKATSSASPPARRPSIVGYGLETQA